MRYVSYLLFLCSALALHSIYCEASQVGGSLGKLVAEPKDKEDEAEVLDGGNDDTSADKKDKKDTKDEEESSTEDAEDAEEEKKLTDAVKNAQTALNKVKKKHADSEAMLQHLEDQDAVDKEIAAKVKQVANQTESKALAKMMGSMWKEMRMFEVPEYAVHVDGELASVAEAEANLKVAQARLDKYNKDDQEESKKSDTETSDAKGPTLGAEVFPVPTSSRCIVIMVVQYMIILTALAVCKTYHEITGTEGGTVQAALNAAVKSLTYGPMLCVLFIACRMRVEFLSKGTGEPQMWVQNCMYALTFAVTANMLLVLAIPLVTGKQPSVNADNGDVESLNVADCGSSTTYYVLTGVRYLNFLGLYGGIAGVIVGTCTYLPPGATDLSKLPPPAPAVMCTMIMTVIFFLTQLVLAVSRTYQEITEVAFPTLVGMMTSAATAVEFAPQLSILFLAARMRALQHDGQPQAWAQSCMYSATIALCLNVMLACVVPFALGGRMKTNPVTRETTFEVPNPVVGVALVALRFLCMIYLYGGAVGVIHSIFTFEAPSGPTAPVSPTVHCVINLTCQFFFVYLVQVVMLTVSEVSRGSTALEKTKLFTALEAAKSTLSFAPMLSILFVTTRMYALLITDKKGAPQAWAQDGMFMATWSLLISFVVCVATGLVLDKVETDMNGNVVNKFSNRIVAIPMLVIRYLAMLLLYGGVALVIGGLFVMTPETANGKGRLPVISDIIDMTPVHQPPPNIGQVGHHTHAL